MAQDFAKKFYSSAAWLKLRNGFLTEHMYVCERCNNKNGTGNIVHHKIYITPDNIDNPEITLNPENLECICQQCHNLEHNSAVEEITADGLTFDACGQLTRKAPR